MTVSLKDGTSIVIRPLEPEDRDELRRGFERLSPEARYRRFFSAVPHLRERDLDYLTQIDHHAHEALLAVDPETRYGIGVARFVRIADGVAEPAVVVLDEWQGRGVGGALLEALVARAREEGITRFEAPVLAENVDAIRAFQRVGQAAVRRDGREVLLSIELPVTEAARTRWPALLRQFAVGAAQPARSVLALVWARRPGSPEDVRRNVIVVGTDGSDHGETAVAAAAELAAASGARIEIVAAHLFLAGREDELRAAMGRASGALRGRGLEVGEHVRRGDASLVLTDVAEELEARLIVVGAGDLGKTARRIVGSVADRVAERAPCSVLIVRPPDYA